MLTNKTTAYKHTKSIASLVYLLFKWQAKKKKENEENRKKKTRNEK